MVEMTETRDILCTATNKSLVILDELGRGTSTFDGMAIADAVLHQLVQSTKCKTLFITHYPLVAASLEHRFPRDVENLHMEFDTRSRIDGTREVTFLYRLVGGLVAESFGIECGRLAGLPESILSVAANRAASIKVQVQQRIKQNRMRKMALLLKQVLSDDLASSTSAMMELKHSLDLLRIFENDDITH